MNAKMITGFSVALLLASGCAATPSPQTTGNNVSTLSKVDRYHAAVEAQARRNGTEVHWVNLPDEGDLARYNDSNVQGANGSN